MTMLKSGWIIVGSLPSTDGTTRTKSDGCLLVIDPNGQPVAAWTGPNINGPWGNMATIDHGTTATLFVSMSGLDVPGPDVKDARGYPIIVKKATILRIDLDIPAGQPPKIKNQTVIAQGFGQRADRDSFLIGPTGLAMSPDGKTLFASDALENQIVAIDDAPTRTTSAGTGRTITKDGLLRRPLSLGVAPNGHLLTCNGVNGQIVEIDPAAGKQLYAQWIDADQAQSPPGNGDLFGFAMTPDGKGFYYVEDDVNALVEAR
jgi:DNA-binding beta-propeller fold protein YncE